MAEPKFIMLARLSDDVEAAQSPKRVPEGKGGHAFIDGKLYRVLDIKEPIIAQAVFAYSVNEQELVHLCNYVDPVFLGFKGLRTTTIAPLTKMSRLRRLSLWWVQKLADLSPIGSLHLDALVLDDLRYCNDISVLSDVQTLKALTISGGMSSSQLINTLEPLADLPALQELRLVSLKLGDDSLRPLAQCKALTDLSLPNMFDVADYAFLAAVRPDIRCRTLCAYEVMNNRIGGKDVMVTGRRRPYLSSKEDGAKIQKYQDTFDALVAGFQADAKDE